ncbi:hypothetical protein HYZ98_01385 [Candidatus Peregrinibacteria bacterium]|nr:hypothetical protein [Candidatus Peregrinibacteria bacterium]
MTPEKDPHLQLADTVSQLAQTVGTLAKRVETSGQPGFVRRWTRRGFLLTLGAAVGAGWVLLKPTKDEEFSEYIPPNEERYRQKLHTWLDQIVTRSGNRFAVTNIDDQGSVYISLPQGLHQQQGTNSLTIETDQEGRLLHLRETQFTTTYLLTELFPKHKDIRKQTGFIGANSGILTQYEWYTQSDALSGWISSDANMRRMQVESGGEIQIIDPESPPETLARQLSTPHRIALFQTLFGKKEGPSNFLELFASGEIPKDFRIPFAEFHRRKFHGNCNDFAEMACEILTRHGYPMHLLTICPALPHEVLEPWHTVAAIPHKNAGFTIIDNGDLLYVNTKEEYAGRQSRESGHPMLIAPQPFGYVEWEKVDAAIGRWLQHVGVRR